MNGISERGQPCVKRGARNVKQREEEDRVAEVRHGTYSEPQPCISIVHTAGDALELW